ncbi:LemA family protein [Methanobrevibacter millerae]|uniref:LemA protein n=1 Tax=Methanobrevibacter millerae TaxID=230361 RepID=A0A1G5X963_9EURY|nr:LemA family protein [Methanobrevibacter millerae]SDA66564.1 LemA protein [Methanobrevibacter millerae]
MDNLILIIIVVVCIIFVVGTLIHMYNNLINLRNRVQNSYSQIDVQLKRRNDLIPNLVETVKGYAAHEKGVLEEVTKARSNVMNANGVEETSEANNQLTGALKTLFAVAENYPDLKANSNFQQLQEQLTDTEDKISYSRQFYNDTVLKYNNVCQQFPSSLLARLFRFKPAEFFQADEASREVPQVEF